MDYENSIIQGDEISIESMKVERAKRIALSIHPYAKLNKIIRRVDNSEVLIITLDIDISQKPSKAIEATEEIAIICRIQDNCFPEVYALRQNFKLGLPHTNAREFERPVCLCITEENFSEVKHIFNSFEFIERIRVWFAKTSRNELHAKDQPLEPFFINSGSVILTKDIDINNFHLKKLSSDSELYIYQKQVSSDSSYLCHFINADKQVHGFVRKQPKTIKDLSDFVLVNGVSINSVLLNFFESNKALTDINKEILSQKLALFCKIPVYRNPEDTEYESFEFFFFVTELTLKEIGLKAGVWDDSSVKLIYLVGKRFDLDFIGNINIRVFSIMQEFDYNSAAFYNKSVVNKDTYTLIGVGALGSQVINLYARTGFGKWNLIDHDILLPHNLARHYLNREYVGSFKADALSNELNSLLNEEFAKPLNSNYFDASRKEQIFNLFKESKYIVDISTSIGIGRSLARDYKERIKAPRISAFLNPSGNDLIVLAEDKNRKNRLDFLEMQYYRMLYREDQLHSHLKTKDDAKIRYASNSCRDITSKINQVDISLLSSICAKTIRTRIEDGKACISIWQIVPDTYEVKRFNSGVTSWIRKDIGEWKVYIDLWLIEKMQAYRKTKLPNETGGILIGSIDTERNIIYIFDTIVAPIDSIETKTTFTRGKEGLIDEYIKYKEVTDNQVLYLGEWHSHPPKSSTNPSNYDIELFADLYNQLHRQGYPTLMGIIGDNDCSILIR